MEYNDTCGTPQLAINDASNSEDEIPHTQLNTKLFNAF